MLTPTKKKVNVCQENSFRGILTARWGTKNVRVVYSDESGVGGIEKEPITVVTAIVIDMDRDWYSIENDLLRVIHLTPAKLLEKGRALKGKNLYSAARKSINVAIEALMNTLAVAVNYRIPIFYGAVDREGFAEYHGLAKLTTHERRASAYDAAFEIALSQVDTAIRTFSENKDEKVLWIAHRSDRQREPSTKTSLLNYRLREEVQLVDDTMRMIRRDPICVADTVYFGNDQESVALQLADVCCSTITLYLLERYYGWRPVVGPFFHQLHRRVMSGMGEPRFMSLKPQ